MRHPLLLALVLSLAPDLALAQPPPPPPPPGDDQALRQTVRERMRAMVVWRLTEALSLDEASAQRFFPVLNRFEERLQPLRQSQAELMRRIRAEVDSRHADPTILGRAIDELLSNRVTIQALELERLREARKVLTPVQQARLVMVMPQIEREMRRHVRRAMNLPDEE